MVYEYGNAAVAMDSYLHGKIPIIDYFSAHALGDVWTELVYCFIHGDINGMLVNPYGGLATIVSYVILFFIVKELFDENVAILFILMFPGNIVGVKWTSICFASIAMLLKICRKPSAKSYVCFWIVILTCAFITYDEGITLGIACILAYLLCCLLQEEWSELKKFVICGASVGSVTMLLYFIYAILTDLPVIGRIKEWISLSVGSSSSWATSDFGVKHHLLFS